MTSMNLEDRILFIDGEAIVIDKPAGPAGRPAARRRRQHRGADRRAEARLQAAAGADAPARPRHVGLPAARAQPQGAGRISSRRSKPERSRKPISRWSMASRRTSEGLIDLPLAKFSSAEAGWRMVPDDGGQGSRDALAQARRGGRAEPGRVPPADRPHPPDPGPCGARAGRGDRRRPGLSLPDDAELADDAAGQRMLLHAWRLVVPREPKPPIDVTAPVPDRFGRWLDFLVKPEDVDIPEDALSETLPRRDRAGRAERQQGRDRLPAARRRVQAWPAAPTPMSG